MGNSNSAKVDNSFFSRLAYQVVHVVKESPAEKCGLMPYFDFLTAVPAIRTFSNCPLPYDEYVWDAIGPLNDSGQPTKSLELTVFNCANARLRKVHLQPDRYSKNRLDLTGFLYRPVIISEAISSVEHVQEISVGSPAAAAGLVPHFDYIIATDEGNCSDLHQIVQPHSAEQSNKLRIYVVDVFLKASRIVDVPGIKKLGERRLGCTLASGYLHRIPTNFPLTFHLICNANGDSSSRSGSSLSRPISRATSVEVGTTLERKISAENPEHSCSNSNEHSHHHHHSHNCSKDNNVLNNQLQHQHQNGKDTSAQKSPPVPQLAEPLDPNSCIFVTRLQLNENTFTPVLPLASKSDKAQALASVLNSKNTETVLSSLQQTTLPVAVQIPKEIVASVVPELVRYQKEHQQTQMNGCQK